MKSLFFVITVLFSLNSLSSETKCSTANGLFSFSSIGYSGGPAPYPGMLINRIQWLFNNTVVFQESTYADCSSRSEFCDQEIDPSSNILWSEVRGPRIVIFNEGGPQDYFTHTIYATQFELKSNDSTEPMTGTNLNEFRDWFICDYRNELRP
ncbi:MAG: hypothetical protein K2P81_05565 [Bacteriovoracaceae bacterium]|nr:hypothetical protein [Bacteriovoracaceae bacterium]